MSFTPFAKMQQKLTAAEDELNEALKELTLSQNALQKEKSSNREMREIVETSSKRLAKNLGRLELLEKKIAYSDFFIQAKDVKCWKKDSDKEVKALALRIQKTVTTLEHLERTGFFQLQAQASEASSPPEDFHCDCCAQKEKSSVLIKDGKVIQLPPQNAGAKTKTKTAEEPVKSPPVAETSARKEFDANLRSQNRQLTGQIDTERKRRREAENEVDGLKSSVREAEKTIERLRENRKADPSASVDVNATARARADATFSQTRLRELQEVINLKDFENQTLHKEVETERQRADLNEKEINRVEKECRELKRNQDHEKFEGLHKKIKDHFEEGDTGMKINVEVMKYYIKDLEDQVNSPDNDALLKRIDACIDKIDGLEKEKKGLKEYIVDVHKRLDESQKDMALVCKRLEYANEKNENLEIRRREFEKMADRMSEGRTRVQEEFDAFKRSVEAGLGELNEQIADEDVEINEEDLENIDPEELEAFLKNF